VVCWWFSSGTPVSSTNKTDRHAITEVLMKVVLSTKTLILNDFTYIQLPGVGSQFLTF